PEPDDAIAEFAGLSHYVETALHPDMPSLPAHVRDRLEALAESPDIDIKALALASLHYALGTDRDVRVFLRDALDSLGANDDAVRRRWTVVLGYLGDRARGKGNTGAAITVYRKALEIRPDDPRVLANMGIAYSDAGDYANAVQALRQSLARDPMQPVTLLNLGNALDAQRDAAGAASAYDQALAINPREPLAYFNLGKLALERGDAARAVQMYERTIALDASLVPAYFNLARAYAMQSNAAKAKAALEQGLAFDPNNAEGREMLRTLQQAIGGQ
ncbi:MAG TPA: tetratricopeptide repeat protein, partial [Gemmatimonadaceae bacterium]|nr:tetratricopeptide repeat protein [Gemmatimonadaceae bacterium]